MAIPERPVPQQETNIIVSPGRRGRQRSEKVYHVFTDGADLWTGKRRKAEKTYRRFVRENGSARMYEEKYKDRENEVMISEHYLKGFGAYPL